MLNTLTTVINFRMSLLGVWPNHILSIHNIHIRAYVIDLWHCTVVLCMASENLSGEAPTPAELGNAGWAVLHATAAAFPSEPSGAKQRCFSEFLHAWAGLYPCGACAAHMRAWLRAHPPEQAAAGGRRAASAYVCEMHNGVNARLGKPTYTCDPEHLLRRWHPAYPHIEDTPDVGPTPPPAGRQGGAGLGQSQQPQRKASMKYSGS